MRINIDKGRQGVAKANERQHTDPICKRKPLGLEKVGVNLNFLGYPIAYL